MAPAKLSRGDRFAIFWGGGLGDVLVIRPLLMALETALDHPPCFFTTATHLEGLFGQLGLRTKPHILPKEPMAALRVIRGVGFSFDWLYLGPHPRIKTRLLAKLVGAKRILNQWYAGTDPFLGEQVLADIKALGLDGPDGARLPYGGTWGAVAGGDKKPRTGHLILHPGVKPGWQTKQWPDERWIALIRALLLESKLAVQLVGMPAEAVHLTSLASGLEAAGRERVWIRTDLSLHTLTGAIRESRGVICHNSGVLHLAAMLGRPTLSLTGSSPLYWRPPYAHVQNLTSGACNLACDQYRCPVPFYRARCIRELSVDAVLVAARAKLFHAA